MPIYDYDGTTGHEIGWIGDWDGTANHQFSKIYDNDGTTNSLVYNSQISLTDISYTGTMEKIDDGNGNWRVKLKSNGTLTFATDGEIDVFLVGGGAGANFYGGGGGGYTRTQKGVSVSATGYSITIGAGGTGNYESPGRGGSTSAFGYTAAGGYCGSKTTAYGAGGNGGSGGGAANESSGTLYKGAGGTNGQNGGAANGASGGKGQISSPGPNGETGNTREFGETTGALYAAGGGGYQATAASRDANTGNGGNGGWGQESGCSGIVVVRNKRD